MVSTAAAAEATFNIRDYGATGRKSDDAHAAIQLAIDAAGAAGGGTVYLPPGEYTSGTLHLRSHVRMLIDSGATLFASLDGKAFDKAALLYGEGVDNITIEGRGTVDGQASYMWLPNGDFDDALIRENMLLAKALAKSQGKPLMRSFPAGYPTETMYPHLILLLRCKDVRIAGLSFVRSRSWTINPYACERLTIDGVYVQSSLKDAVWADGIDPDGCKDVRISNSTIETGDDAIVLWSSNIYGPPLPLAVVRRGYGKSGGQPDYLQDRCVEANYQEAGRESAEDLSRAIEYGASLPRVDAAHVIAMGVSMGGFATVALTAKAPPGLVAAISFAGGLGSRADFDLCNPGELIGAFRNLGKHSRTPMLWVYAENDRFFWPEMAHKFDEAFRAGGGQDQFVQAPATRGSGHGLFGRVADWSSIVDDFLKAQNLVWLREPLPPPKTPDEPPPPGLSEAGERAFRNYLLAAPHKAFAMSEHRFSFYAAQVTAKMAEKKALDNCRHASPKGEKCAVVSVDGVSQDEK